MKLFIWKVNRLFWLFIVFCCGHLVISAQNFNWAELKSMPEPTSNNAITAARVEGMPYVYSFGGIDSTKLYSGIHLRAYRFSVTNNAWETIQSLPDTLGKIALAASTVKNKIYIIGGYHVLNSGTELSSNKVHVFDPESNSYLPDATPIPVPIDDHVQAVWRDSLIYVISGWSNSNNVANVQVYSPSGNTWQIGTPVPNNSNFKVFGASGVIIGDTIYYAGGAKFGFAFPLGTFFRKGAINPNNPTQITWLGDENLSATGYRMGASSFEDKAIWLGGSLVSYNYNGIAYNGSGGVPPTDRMLVYNRTNNMLTAEYGILPPVMDLRGVAKISPNQFIIAGGMNETQKVSNKTILLTEVDYTGLAQQPQNGNELNFYPNPANRELTFETTIPANVCLYNSVGNCVLNQAIQNRRVADITSLTPGLYTVEINFETGNRLPQYSKLIIQR